jgi:UDP-N-acetylmuramoyl-tripeptide--D-alanyl-D-alanine ligase
MICNMTMQECVDQISGSLLLGCDKEFSDVVTDSRKIKKGDLFVALCGEHYDGHDYVEKAIKAGAVGVVVSKKMNIKDSQLVVEDTLIALAELGRYNRELFTGKVIALTGSAGKTTVKEMIAFVLSAQGSVISTQGNFNNEIGVPLSLLSIEACHQYAVIEMGAAKPRDIEYLMKYVKPDVGVLLNVLPAHLEGFGSVENIAQTKLSVIEDLEPGCLGVINADNEYVAKYRNESGNVISHFGFKENDELSYDVFAQDVMCDAWSSEFTLCLGNNTTKLKLNLPGKHNIYNALATVSAAVNLGVSDVLVVEQLEGFQGVDGRMMSCDVNSYVTVIDDSYNANPSSMKKAIDVLERMSEKRILIMGDMAELGAYEKQAHEEIGNYAQSKIDHLWTIGELAQEAGVSFGEGGIHFESRIQLITHIKAHLNKKSVMLVKGSRSSKMDELVTIIKEFGREI